MSRFFLLFFLTLSLFADDTQNTRQATMLNDPSTLIEGKVSAITGEPLLVETDMIIQGAEPIRIYRSYVSYTDSKQKKQWKWVVNSSLAIYQKSDKDYRCLVAEKNGCPIWFKRAHTLKINGVKYTRFDASDLNVGFSNTCYGTPSSRTHLKNDYLLIQGTSTEPDEVKFFTYHAADGTVREYKKIHDPNEPDARHFRLLSEHLPNGRWVIYDYDETTEKPSSWWPSALGGDTEKPKFWLKSIRTMNPAKTKVLAKADFVYENRDENSLCYSVLGSDGQVTKYRYRSGRLAAISPANGLNQFLDYVDCEGMWQQTKTRLPEDRFWTLDYYRKDKETVASLKIKLNEEDKRRFRVKTISAPVGKDSGAFVTHSLVYDLDRPYTWENSDTHITSVYDIEGNKTDYIAMHDLRLHRVFRYDQRGTFLNGDRFFWDFNEGNLLFKTLIDANKKPVVCRGYTYDARANVTEERLFGNLSGQRPEILLNSNLNPIENGNEFYTKHFRYTTGDTNLLLEEQEPSGKRTVYSYLPNTDLISSCFLYDRDLLKLRTFFEYDEDHTLIREIHDDGHSPNKDDLSGVMVRTIRETRPCKTGSYVGMPEIIEEKYWEKGSEHLLKKTVLTYTAGGRVAKQDVYDADGVFRYSLKTAYDSYGHPIEQTNPIGQKKLAGYDPCGNCNYTQEFSGRSACTVEYDHSNRPVEVECIGDDNICRKTTYSYDKKHKLTQETDFRGNSSSHTHDALGRLIESQLPKVETKNGQIHTPIVRKSHDCAGNEITSVDPEGNITTKTYNAYGKPVLVIHPDGAKEQYLYNLDGTLRVYTDAVGVQTMYTYDFLGRVVSKKTASAEERFEYHGQHLVAKIDAEGNRTEYKYDGAGRKIGEECAGELISYGYDALGRLHKTRAGNLVSVTEFDLLDRTVETREESVSGDIFRKTQVEYDAASNQSCLVRFLSDKQTREEQRFDSLGRLIEKTDPLGHKETIGYNDEFKNSLGQKVLQKTQMDPLQLQTVEIFDAHNRMVKTEKRAKSTVSIEEKWLNLNGMVVSQANTIFSPGGETRKVYTEWEYDRWGRPIGITEAAGTVEAKITRYGYTLRGELGEVIKPDGTQLRYTYSDLGFLTELNSSDQTVHHTMKYNRCGHVVQTDQFERAVDAKGRILKETFLGKYSIENKHDITGKRVSCKIPTANCVIEYEYNPIDLTRVVRKRLDGSTLYTHTYGPRDLSGSLESETLIGNHGVVHYGIDELGRKTKIVSPRFNQEAVSFDPVGNIRHLRTQNEDALYDYDPLYQLTSETGRFSHTYTYDSLYNRLEKDTDHYQINDLQQVVSHMHYTKNGNPDRFHDMQYTYDALDRLIAIRSPRFTQTFLYDSENRCLTKTTTKNNSSETRYFLYDHKNEIGALNEGLRPVELRILGVAPHAEIGAAISIELGENVYAPVHDLQGNVAALLPLQKEDPTFFRYSAFGECTTVGTLLNMPWKFCSKRADEQSGLVFFGRRFYVPELGRWLTPDPSGFTDGMNLYAFVLNDPLTHLDEYGLATVLPEARVESFYYHPWKMQKPPPFSILGGRGFSSDPSLSPHYYVNGILNTRDDCISGAKRLLQTHGGVAAIIPVYSESDGFMTDIRSVPRIRKDPTYDSFAVRYLHRNVAWHCLAFEAMNDPRKIFITGFSRGTADIYHAIKDLPQKQKDRLIITGCGNIMILPRDLGFRVRNLISEKDICALHFHGGLVWGSLRKNPQKYESFADVHILPDKGGFPRNFTAHEFASEAYQNGIKKYTVPDYDEFGRLHQ